LNWWKGDILNKLQRDFKSLTNLHLKLIGKTLVLKSPKNIDSWRLKVEQDSKTDSKTS